MAVEPGDDSARACALLRAQFECEVENIQPLAGGVFSRAFTGTVDDRSYVIRLSTFAHAAESYAKDAYAGEHFSSPSLPVPRVIATGREGDDHFVISERVAGHTLAALPPTDRQALLP